MTLVSDGDLDHFSFLLGKTSEGINFAEGADSLKKIQVLRQVDAFAWVISLRSESNASLSKIGRLLWTLGRTLESIAGVSVSLDSSGQGSWRAKVSVHFKTAMQRKEVREFMEAVREGLVAKYFSKYREEEKKLVAERKQLESENEKTIFKLKPEDVDNLALPAVPGGQDITLDNLEKLARIERIFLENQLLRIEMAQKAAELLSDGIIDADPLEIRINDVDYLSVLGGTLKTGASMEEIERSEERLKTDENSDPDGIA